MESTNVNAVSEQTHWKEDWLGHGLEAQLGCVNVTVHRRLQ